MTKLTDLDPMPFGKYRGTPMQDVPAHYLHYLWTHGKNEEACCPVHHYIKENMDCLKQEYKDGIWE